MIAKQPARRRARAPARRAAAGSTPSSATTTRDEADARRASPRRRSRRRPAPTRRCSTTRSSRSSVEGARERGSARRPRPGLHGRRGRLGGRRRPPEQARRATCATSAAPRRVRLPRVYYGHFGQGCVHTRIDFDLKTAAGVKTSAVPGRSAPTSSSRYGGSLSGEHGEGQARAELLPKMFGAELMRRIRRVQADLGPRRQDEPTG